MFARLRRHSAAAAAVVALVVSPLLASCGVGNNAFTTAQAASGNGVFVTLGDLALANITLVQGPAGSKSITVLGNITNVGTTPDALVSVTLDAPASKAYITGGQLPVLARTIDPVTIGYRGLAHVNFYDVDPTISTFVPMTFTFRDAGAITLRALVVPPTGIYEGIAPEPATAPAP